MILHDLAANLFRKLLRPTKFHRNRFLENILQTHILVSVLPDTV